MSAAAWAQSGVDRLYILNCGEGVAGDISRWNPVFYTIDGFRYGFFAVSDVSPWHSLAVVGAVFIALCFFALRLLASGYKLRT
jgi:ABC-type polysaccharide/polyol phosphate export permease